MKIVKRNGKSVDYDREKIRIAIGKANICVSERDRITDRQIENIIKYIESLNKKRMLVEDIQDIIEEKIMGLKKYHLAKEYITYRYTRALVRKSNTTDETILGIIRNSNSDMVSDEYRSILLAAFQREYIAGEVSRDLTRRILLPEHISKAHLEGVLHFHDAEYFVQPIFRSSFINLADMFSNGFVIHGVHIDTPKTFKTSCVVLMQILSVVLSNQYGGISVSLSTFGPYIRKSEEKITKQIKEKYQGVLSYDEIQTLVDDMLKDEIRQGVQTIFYQLNTMAATHLRFPVVTFFLQLEEDDPYLSYNAVFFEEFLHRMHHIFNDEKGNDVVPQFLRVAYVLDSNNSFQGGKYDSLTRFAVTSSIKGLPICYLSAKKMREYYDECVFPPIGDSEFLTPYQDKEGAYSFAGRFDQGMVSINLVQIAMLSRDDEEKFFELLDSRLELCREALLCRHDSLLGATSDVAPIQWQYGAISRCQQHSRIDSYFNTPYSSLFLGYLGLYEVCMLVKGVSHTEPDVGLPFALKVMKYLEKRCEVWKRETGLGFSLCGVHDSKLSKRFARLDKEQFGTIKNITDKTHYTSSYHVSSTEDMNLFDQLMFESQFVSYSLGGNLSYASSSEIDEVEKFVSFLYENVLYLQVLPVQDEKMS